MMLTAQQIEDKAKQVKAFCDKFVATNVAKIPASAFMEMAKINWQAAELLGMNDHELLFCLLSMAAECANRAGLEDYETAAVAMCLHKSINIFKESLNPTPDIKVPPPTPR